MTVLGDALRDRRKSQHLTQQQLAAAIGCSPSVLSGAETGLHLPFRPFWERADGMTGAGGALLRMFDGAPPDPEPVWPAWDKGPAP